MPIHRHHSSAFATGFLTLVLILGFTLRTHFASAVDCVGKPYGYPGCPTRPSSAAASSSSGSGHCGNAIVEDAEECDTGRFNGNGPQCNVDCTAPKCGNGAVERNANEECEPQTEEAYVQDKSGNLTTETHFTDGPDCGWYCPPPVCNEKGACSGGCKLKNIRECPIDESSSGSGSNGSASSGQSSEAVHAAAPSSSTASSVRPAPVCGNGVQEVGEDCDDGNAVQNDECTNACRKPVCGDGVVQKGEECDDSNQDPSDNCTNRCTLPRCGDGIKQAKEQCDEGSGNSDTTPNVCRKNCLLPRCGDGLLDRDEQCDVGDRNSNTASDACRTNCRLAFCGDGVVDKAEQCDDANRSDTDDCTNTCKKAGCGDGVVQKNEECDWGTKNSNSQANACRASCKMPFCGDTVVDAGEQCDPSAPLGAGGGKDCTKECKVKEAASSSSLSSSSKKPDVAATTHAAADSGGDGWGMAIPVALAGTGALIILGSLLFRRKIVALFSGGGARSIDDIPLDQIEMPWHRW